MKKIFLVFTLILSSITYAQKTNPPNLKLGEPLPANLFVELAKALNPAVVNISTKVRIRQFRGYRDPFFDMLEQMYGIRPQQQEMPNNPRPYSLGTGFIIREDGLIVTNNHVINGADEIDVQLSEKAEKFYRAKVIGSDERTDIALIQIEGKNFPTVSLGSSADTQVGEWVAAFGNPYGQGHTMTKGIVSAKGRDISEINRFPMIQTDAPINPGNSGGPLVNSKGQVIGVNSAIDPRAQGIGFAIPIDEVKALLPQLEKNGKIKKAFLGVQLADLDPRTASALGLKDLEGALVARVEKNSPASKAGLQTYDVINEINGKKIRNSFELTNSIADTNIGSKVTVKYIREGKPKSADVTLAERPEFKTNVLAEKNKKGKGIEAPYDLGFQVSEPTPQLKKEFELDEDINKPIVVFVDPRSMAAQAGLLPGDIILDINRKEINSAQEVAKALKKGTNTIRLVRQQSVIFIMLQTN